MECKVLIVDFGSQYTQLIARRVRELKVYCEIHSWQRINKQFIENFAPDCAILSGGPESVTRDNPPTIDHALFDCGIPVLGICYGMQQMASCLGGIVETSVTKEFGHARIKRQQADGLFEGLEEELDVWMSHGDKVMQVPPGFTISAKSVNSPVAAMADETRKLYGIQFHPEVTHTPQGMLILERFIVDIAHTQQTWETNTILEEKITQIREQVGEDQVILGLSGGVDSSVAAVLIHRAIGQQLHCVFVDTGLLRQGEAEQVIATFKQHIGVDLIHVNAEDEFLEALKGIADPEQKRRVIGGLFIDIFEREAKRLDTVKWLAQGTIYPDVIESATDAAAGAHLIKSHHNVGGLPKRMNLKLLEPLSTLFKDEVRQLGLQLGLSTDIIERHPFPGPGLAVRVLGEIKKEYLEILRKADYIFIEELRNHDLYHKVAQAFVVFLPVKSVGVMGDGRDYSYVVVLRAVETSDFMTAECSALPQQFLNVVATRIVNEVPNISRVCYDITNKPPATIEWE